MSRTLEGVFTQVKLALAAAVEQMARAVPQPRLIRSAAGHPTYRYREQLPQQALVLKTVRMMSALIAGKKLVDAGLAMDAGASMRILDELGSDIMFLAGPLVTGHEPEERHGAYLTEFFQEEFDHADPIQASQSRRRVSRRDIRAYVARTFNVGAPVSEVVAVTATIDNAFSGYIHGAATHIMDAFDGSRFCVPLELGDDPLEAVRDQFPQYIHRAIMNAATAAKAVGCENLFHELYELQRDLFDDYGTIL